MPTRPSGSHVRYSERRYAKRIVPETNHSYGKPVVNHAVSLCGPTASASQSASALPC
jgi:hypothetical protein